MRARDLYIIIAIIVVAIAGVGAFVVPTLAARPFLSNVNCSPAVISPNGDEVDDDAYISYSLSKNANITVSLVGSDGQTHILRQAQDRAPDDYQITFNGAIAVDGTSNYRILPDDTYHGTITAKDADGKTLSQTFDVTLQNADTTAPEVSNVVPHPSTISPNGDAFEDEMSISYELSKKAETTLYVTDKDGNYSLLDPPTEREAAIQSFTWNGTENGGNLLANGDYTLHILATDESGNITETTSPLVIDNGGTPRLEITKAKFTPTTIPLGGTVHVSITVKNVGDTVIKWDDSMGPAPGTQYTTDMTYGYWRDAENKPLYYERNGVWRVGITWTNVATQYPVRWSLGKTLQPGEETTVTGEIVVTQKDEEIYFSAAVEQGGVGFPGGQKGTTKVEVSY